MSEQRQVDRQGTFGLQGNLEAVHKRQEAVGVHDHQQEAARTIDHLASIYERQEDQFAAVVPFIQQGLERDEQCLYIADDNTAEAVQQALREGGIDVEAALESGSLTIRTKADTYLRTGEFDREAMLEFWRETLTQARDEDEYTGVRAAAEMTWALDENTGLDTLVEYEALLNTLYEGDDYAVLCQYNRDRFPTDVLSDVIRSHPLVVSDGTVCQNFYYHPPDEFFGTDHPELDVDRTVEGLVSRARTRHALQERERQLHERLQQQKVVADLGRLGLEELDLDHVFAEATEQVAATLDADYCKVLELLSADEELLLREGVGWKDGIVGEATVGTDRDSQAGYTLLSEEPVIVEDLSTEERFSGPDLLVDHDVTSGISVVIGSPEDPWGVLGVHTRDERTFSQHDAAFVQSIANTVATAIERAERDRYQRDLYEIMASPEPSFEEKLQPLFDLGCEYFDLDLGGLARVDPWTDRFEVEYVSADNDDLEAGAHFDLSETYCQVHTMAGEPASIIDPESAGLAETTAFAEFGLRSYLGTRITIENDLDRTFFFVSDERRHTAFSEADRTFLDLMAQWVQSEFERRQYEKKLEESNERLQQFAYAASHDLQEPLRMVSSYLQLLETRYKVDLDADAEEFIDFAVDGADRMRAMIDGLLDYSRVESQGEPLEPTDLETVLDDVLTDLQFLIEETDAEITSEPLPTVEGDADQLRQVFQNLLDNAIEYSGDDPPRVHIAAEQPANMWRISVSDEGIGIDADDNERIFEVFQRLHAPDEHTGTGIGLALSERIIERHEGDIWVASDPGDGSTFSFTVPATRHRDS